MKGKYQPSGWKRYKTPEESFAARTKWQGDCLVWTGAKNEDGYGQIWADGRMHRVHLWAWKKHFGSIPKGRVVDHTCHNPACCNTSHLRIATKGQNQSNRKSANTNSKSGVRNVRREGSGWRVRMQRDGISYEFGTYQTIGEAEKVAIKKRQELFGQYAGISDPTGETATNNVMKEQVAA